MNIQDCFPLGWTGWISLQSKGLSKVFSNTTVQNHQLFSAQLSLWSNSHIHTWLIEKPQLYGPLSAKWRLSFLIYCLALSYLFFQGNKHLLVLWLQSMSSVILEPKKIKSVTASTFSPSICHEMIEPDAMILCFKCWVLSQLFHFPLSSSSRGSFSSSSLSAIRVVSSAYLRLLVFPPAILIPACASSSPAFLMMYSAYKLNNQGDNIQPWRTPFSFVLVLCSMLGSNCCSLMCIQISQEAGKMLWYFHLFKNFQLFVVIHTVKGCSRVNKAEVDVFLEFPCFFYDPTVWSVPHGNFNLHFSSN